MTTLAHGNLFHGVPTGAPDEVFTTLLARQATGGGGTGKGSGAGSGPGSGSGAVTIERIVSNGQASPAGFWYDVPQQEWVLVLSGGAGLEIGGEPAIHTMQPGDWIHLPAHCRHRVAWTDTTQPTIWLAIHMEDFL